MKKFISLLLALLVLTSLAVPAMAADGKSTLTVKSKTLFTYDPESKYTDSDLFSGFKNMMPGDRLEQDIRIKNQSWASDYIKVYLRAVPHEVTENEPIYDRTAAARDGKANETVRSMNDFLSKLQLKVYQISGTTEKLIFEGSPDEADGLENKVYLGSLRRNKEIQLRAELYWYPDANDDNDPDNDYNYNDYMNRVGEVDWEFTVEYRDDPSDSPKTGDYIIMAAAVLMVVSALGLVLLFVLRKKRKK